MFYWYSDILSYCDCDCLNLSIFDPPTQTHAYILTFIILFRQIINVLPELPMLEMSIQPPFYKGMLRYIPYFF